MNAPKLPRPKRASLRTPEGGTVIFDFEEQAALWLRIGYPQVAIDRLRDGGSIESGELRAAIADFMEGKIKRKRGAVPPWLPTVQNGSREARELQACFLFRAKFFPEELAKEQGRRRLNRELSRGARAVARAHAMARAAAHAGVTSETFARIFRRRKGGKE